MKLNYPRVNTNQNQKVFVSFFIQNKRYRLYNGSRIGSNTNPNSFPLEQRKSIANLLAAEVYNYLINGGVLESYRNNEIISGKLTDKDYLIRALKTKLKGTYSNKYKPAPCITAIIQMTLCSKSDYENNELYKWVYMIL